MMRAYVDPDVCIGCGLCISSVPDVFRMGDDGRAEAVGDGMEDAVQQAIDACPVSAIQPD